MKILLPFLVVAAIAAAGYSVFVIPAEKPTTASAPQADSMDTYYRWMETNLDALETDLPAISASADAAAEKYVTGEWDLCAEGDPGVVGEVMGRAGGIMRMLWGIPDRKSAGQGKQIVLMALREDQYEQSLKLAREKLSDADSFVILMGTAALLERAQKDGFPHANTLCTQAAPGDGLFLASGKPMVSTSPVANMAAAWTWSAEFVSACVRHGKMPAMYQSFAIPGAQERAEKLKGMRFEEKCPAAVAPGALGRAYLKAARLDLKTLYTAERGNLEAASRLAFDAIREGHTAYAFLHGHSLVAQQLTYRASPGIFTQLNTGWCNQNPQLALKTGDFVLCIGYADRFHDGEFKQWDDSARQSGAVLAWSFTDFHPEQAQAVRDAGELWINQHWALGDAVVELPGYELKMFPTSGLVAQAALRLVEAGTFALNRL